ncbi:hypothetical protein KKC08_05745 [Patescibacteria group bacterium]|nr:hypothetical protein [Patescibacteria group bacterium]MCG2702200.1 hypothetical protein [Candidatus Parcubacteria bacterium]MBU4210129.1 hypothetical protein [Patescibacteria group bacterium]MBU4264786.1 hypothetical protein [Patescibacteria group bacterium]MBU4390124.1 hypothetical protein [Patescibacteria group bacterium]
MLTKDQIKKKLKSDSEYELPDSASDQEWDWYVEAKDEIKAGHEDYEGVDNQYRQDEDSWKDEDYNEDWENNY